VRIAFLVNDLQLSGGVGVVIHHAQQLTRHGHDVSLVLVREQDLPHWGYDALEGLHVLSLVEAQGQRFDVAVATWWETTYSLFTVPAERYAYFVQSLEDRFYEAEMVERLGASLTLDLPVAFITEACWIRDTLAELRPDARCYFVRNGIDKAIFPAAESVEPRLRGPLRILIEGNPSVALKGIQDAVASVGAMREPRHVTVVTSEHDAFAGGGVDRVIGPVPHREMAALYAETDVVLKLSRVEGMFGPPLEGFHLGATCVVTEVTGHEEYIQHGWNGLVADWDDPAGTARLMDRLARDPRELHFLRTNALATAQSWPDWEQAGQFMTLALERIRRESPPPATAGAARLMADVRTGMMELSRPLEERRVLGRAMKKIEGIIGLPGMSQLVAGLRGTPGRQLITVAKHTLQLIAAVRALPITMRTAVADARARIVAAPGRARAAARAKAGDVRRRVRRTRRRLRIRRATRGR
jgi:glycosyltransferase involved in cell wall biosynthesis